MSHISHMPAEPNDTRRRTSQTRQALSPARQGLRNLFSYQVRQLANIYSKGSASSYLSDLGLTMNEWRLIALIDTAGAISMNRLSAQAQFDRGLTSRLVGTLVDRGYFARRAASDDGRGVLVSLTRRGRAIVARVLPQAQRRNERLLSCLTPAERRTLQRIVAKLTRQALTMLESDRRR